ncbi:lysine N(6)-hydroxylase/L-ornithine N(5)-oxygenase family protein [Chitinilyticum piscinae]|uniref:SidA/IucD/PvdA family monooxygenase n=1 Tax=Chitinilyticum piscinae TaxID=2866724 RepID=A0A8J7K2Y6_9NEIS|nr:SidA/IucD/PvdA family monooxygenase [Chitinilyticum piscinae]MBE9610642.1 SidA/IucD/PvdA family monooxygenase [Chitinilyticum piscinae]
MQTQIYDFIGIGLGPFNLGLAALSAPLGKVNALFLDMGDGFDWHPGMLLEQATMQTSFIADLVTFADPTSPYSFLNYAKQTGRLYAFYIREDFFLLRQEYNQYCQWVAAQLANLRFNQYVQHVHFDEALQCYVLNCLSTRTGEASQYLARRLVLGTGTRPTLPRCCEGKPVLHSSRYLDSRSTLQQRKHIALVGSGQSAAEIYLDLLREARRHGYQVDWITRSPRFFPLEYTKLTLEMTSPDYIDYFHALPDAIRDPLLSAQKGLYKGINRTLINAIFDELYRLGLEGAPPSTLLTNTELQSVQYCAEQCRFTLDVCHQETAQTRSLHYDAVIVASGYGYQEPAFLQGIQSRIARDAQGRFAVQRNYSIDLGSGDIFVQNAELHSHGLAAPDLTMACYRNSVILREILGYAPYPIEERVSFQTFGLPGTARRELAWA